MRVSSSAQSSTIQDVYEISSGSELEKFEIRSTVKLPDSAEYARKHSRSTDDEHASPVGLLHMALSGKKEDVEICDTTNKCSDNFSRSISSSKTSNISVSAHPPSQTYSPRDEEDLEFGETVDADGHHQVDGSLTMDNRLTCLSSRAGEICTSAKATVASKFVLVDRAKQKSDNQSDFRLALPSSTNFAKCSTARKLAPIQ